MQYNPISILVRVVELAAEGRITKGIFVQVNVNAAESIQRPYTTNSWILFYSLPHMLTMVAVNDTKADKVEEQWPKPLKRKPLKILFHMGTFPTSN